MADNDIKKTDTHPIPTVDTQDDTPPPFRRVEAGDGLADDLLRLVALDDPVEQCQPLLPGR